MSTRTRDAIEVVMLAVAFYGLLALLLVLG